MPNSPIKLHLGAFNCGIAGWVNTDITSHLVIARIPFAASILHLLGKMSDARYQEHIEGRFRNLKYVNLTKPLPYENESVSAVFSSHVLEHLFFDEIEGLIAEIHRVLVVRGVCRVVVPDLEKIVQRFDPNDPQAFLMQVYETGERSAVKNAHHWGFTGPSLVKLFETAGFAQAYVTEYRKGKCPDIDRLDNRPESLFVEAIK